jgi:hypothetical protein
MRREASISRSLSGRIWVASKDFSSAERFYSTRPRKEICIHTRNTSIRTLCRKSENNIQT